MNILKQLRQLSREFWLYILILTIINGVARGAFSYVLPTLFDPNVFETRDSIWWLLGSLDGAFCFIAAVILAPIIDRWKVTKALRFSYLAYLLGFILLLMSSFMTTRFITSIGYLCLVVAVTSLSIATIHLIKETSTPESEGAALNIWYIQTPFTIGSVIAGMLFADHFKSHHLSFAIMIVLVIVSLLFLMLFRSEKFTKIDNDGFYNHWREVFGHDKIKLLISFVVLISVVRLIFGLTELRTIPSDLGISALVMEGNSIFIVIIATILPICFISFINKYRLTSQIFAGIVIMFLSSFIDFITVLSPVTRLYISSFLAVSGATLAIPRITQLFIRLVPKKLLGTTYTLTFLISTIHSGFVFKIFKKHFGSGTTNAAYLSMIIGGLVVTAILVIIQRRTVFRRLES